MSSIARNPVHLRPRSAPRGPLAVVRHAIRLHRDTTRTATDRLDQPAPDWTGVRQPLSVTDLRTRAARDLRYVPTR